MDILLSLLLYNMCTICSMFDCIRKKLRLIELYMYSIGKKKALTQFRTHFAFFGFLGSNGLVQSDSSQSILKSSPKSRGTKGVRWCVGLM